MTNKNDSVQHDRFGAAAKDDAKKAKAKKGKKTPKPTKKPTPPKAKKPTLLELASGKPTETDKALATVAKEINTRLEKAKQADGKARDHRLAVALLLSAAKLTCQKSGIDFKKWTSGFDLGWENTRKLVAIGDSDDPKKAIEDLRLKDKARFAAKRAEAKVVQTTTPEPERSEVEPTGSDFARATPEPVGYMDLLGMITQLKTSEQVTILKELAAALGFGLTTGFEDTPASDEYVAPNPDDETAEYDGAIAAIATADAGETDQAGEADIPAFLKRNA